MASKGIDVSHYDGSIYWNQVANSGVSFAMIHAGFGESLENLDPTFRQNVEGALAAGVHVGLYWFSYAYTVEMARIEAQCLMEAAAPYKGRIDYPLSFDWEYASDTYAQQQGVNPSNQLITDMAIAFMTELEQGGWYAMNYSNLDYYYNKFQMDRLTNFDLWLADYNGSADIPCGIQQTGDSAQIAGIASAGTDSDVAYKDYPTIIKAAGLNGYPKPEPSGGGGDSGMIYNTIDEVPDWARPTVQMLVDKGWLKGNGDGQLGLNDTMLRLLVINDRAGLYA